MPDAPRSESPESAHDAKVREEWRRLERQRIDEEIAEAREDVGAAGVTRGPHWLVWMALALALVAGIVVTAIINGLYDPRS